jgi:16S rRNA (adenine1518-N6/adenine1519-N6)-dimethyltransferase
MIRPKKSLGQNFLKSPAVVEKILGTADLKPTDLVLEIGPGEGILTGKLLQRAGRVVAVEKDDRLIPLLQKKFAGEIATGKLQLCREDALKFNPAGFLIGKSVYKIVANIPYYITGELIRKFLSEWPQPSAAVILVQKEVARRIVGQNKKESLLSISVKAYGEPRYVATVKAGAFSPAPKVDSAILLVEKISKDFFRQIDEQKFFAVVRAGFSHKRKIILSNLKALFGDRTKNRLALCRLSENDRAEDLPLEKWRCLATETSKGPVG